MLNNSPKFIFIAYKPSSDDYCRGCLMASYSSDHVIYYDLDEEELITKWSTYIYENMYLQDGELGYLFWIFMDGKKIVSDSYVSYYYNGEDDGLDDSEAIYKRTLEIEQRAIKIAKEKREIREKVKADQERFRKARIEQEEKERKRKQYKELKKRV